MCKPVLIERMPLLSSCQGDQFPVGLQVVGGSVSHCPWSECFHPGAALLSSTLSVKRLQRKLDSNHRKNI